MTPLPTDRTKNGCYYRLLHRTGKTACYSVRYSPDGPIKGFDVFMVRISPRAAMPSGSIMDEHEHFPSNEDFGKIAWSYTTQKTAMEKFAELEQSPSKERSCL